MTSPEQHRDEQHRDEQHDEKPSIGLQYLRFAAMILTSMVVMYAVMFLGSWEWSHVRFSESRLFMTLTMGGAMVVVMMAWMLGMYRSTRANVAIIGVGVLMVAGGVALDRTQATVQDASFMSGMIPHHSLAITRSERTTLDDVRVCELGVEIREAQRREISEMEWLIDDIAENGIASTPEEAAERPVPDFSEPADRQCPGS
ncbi:MAG: DUF305 domain-containing protein [Microcella sp.]|uniref:DUF305 domain-containing protein n=1 Tax=Microcella sp. TaxID=1913979 RepID=UPI002718320A|nr:DUF305 domain-containing protein [Microcella sp.]MDO8336729.1 DUF305 domain-containing protein [Microcella sp.]